MNYSISTAIGMTPRHNMRLLELRNKAARLKNEAVRLVKGFRRPRWESSEEEEEMVRFGGIVDNPKRSIAFTVHPTLPRHYLSQLKHMRVPKLSEEGKHSKHS